VAQAQRYIAEGYNVVVDIDLSICLSLAGSICHGAVRHQHGTAGDTASSIWPGRRCYALYLSHLIVEKLIAAGGYRTQLSSRYRSFASSPS
jgi:peptidoglycan/LPS O-acetylase OafA/YrhL